MVEVPMLRRKIVAGGHEVGKKLKDMLETAAEVGTGVGLSVAGMVADHFMGASSVVGDLLLSGALSNLPAIGGFFLSYQQKRAEAHLWSMIRHLEERVTALELYKVWEAKPEHSKALLRDIFAGIVCDYVIDEKKSTKIPYLTNGLIS